MEDLKIELERVSLLHVDLVCVLIVGKVEQTGGFHTRNPLRFLYHDEKIKTDPKLKSGVPASSNYDNDSHP